MRLAIRGSHLLQLGHAASPPPTVSVARESRGRRTRQHVAGGAGHDKAALCSPAMSDYSDAVAGDVLVREGAGEGDSRVLRFRSRTRFVRCSCSARGDW